MIRTHVMICGGTGCTSSDSPKIAEAMENEIVKLGLQDEVKVVRTGCFGLCENGPVMIIYPDGIALMANIKNNLIFREIKRTTKGNCGFHNTEISG